jgi:hypothetical protein
MAINRLNSQVDTHHMAINNPSNRLATLSNSSRVTRHSKQLILPNRVPIHHRVPPRHMGTERHRAHRLAEPFPQRCRQSASVDSGSDLSPIFWTVSSSRFRIL